MLLCGLISGFNYLCCKKRVVNYYCNFSFVIFLTLGYILVLPDKLYAQEIELIASMPDRAVLKLADEIIMLSMGEVSLHGIKLHFANSKIAKVEFEEKIIELSIEPKFKVLSSEEIASHAVKKKQMTLWADSEGFFRTLGKINHNTVQFLLDTGANAVAISTKTAHVIGLDLESGEKGVVSTAAGVANMTGVILESISIGPFEFENIFAVVIEGDYPETPLLGDNFLKLLNMSRSGKQMVLSLEH